MATSLEIENGERNDQAKSRLSRHQKYRGGAEMAIRNRRGIKILIARFDDKHNIFEAGNKQHDTIRAKSVMR